MAGYQVIFTLISVSIALIFAAPIFALLGFLIFRAKHRNVKRGALYGAAIPLLFGIIGITPFIVGIFVKLPFDVQSAGTSISMTVPVLSIPVGIIVLLAMLIFAKSEASASRG